MRGFHFGRSGGFFLSKHSTDVIGADLCSIYYPERPFTYTLCLSLTNSVLVEATFFTIRVSVTLSSKQVIVVYRFIESDLILDNDIYSHLVIGQNKACFSSWTKNGFHLDTAKIFVLLTSFSK